MLVFFGIANVFMGFIALNVSTSLRVAYGCWVGFMILVYMLYQPMKTVRQSFLAHSRRRARNSFYLYPSSSLALSLPPFVLCDPSPVYPTRANTFHSPRFRMQMSLHISRTTAGLSTRQKAQTEGVWSDRKPRCTWGCNYRIID